MPLRGSLFIKLKKLKAKRQKAEGKKFKKEVKSEAASLKILRKTRIKEEGRSLLKQQISKEKARIKAARGPTKIGRIEGFLLKQTRKGLTAAEKKAIKEIKKRKIRIEFNPGGKGRKKSKRRKKRS